VTTAFSYQRLGYVALNVTDLTRSLAFYRDLAGLDVTETAEDVVALRCSQDHHNVLLYPASSPGLKRAAFELESERELDKARGHIEGVGLQIEDVDKAERERLKLGPAFRFREPTSGLCLEFFAGMMHMATPFAKKVANIERLGHVVVNVRGFDRVLDFFVRDLGFRVSDYVTGFAAFLRCFPNPLHHSLAILASDEDRLHHVNFMVRDIDDVGKALHRMRKAGVDVVFGPGRHQPSGSIFLYFLEPDGMTLEYSYGMEEFPAATAREPRMLEPVPEALDQWGSLPAPGFAKVGRIEVAP
jgi:2,3-dihydroxy-p-cumate/2,3-dihydroxybenzoate 3,4-dioxygenase